MRTNRLILCGIVAAIVLAAQCAAADTLEPYELEGRWFQISVSAKGIAGPPAFQELPLVKTKFKTTYYMYFDFDSIGGEHYDLIMVYEDSPGVWTSQTIEDYIPPAQIYQYGEFGEAYQLPAPDSGYNFYDPAGFDIDLYFTGMIVLKPDKKNPTATPKGAKVYMSGVTNDGYTADGSVRSATVKIKGRQVVEPGGDTGRLPFDPDLFLP